MKRLILVLFCLLCGLGKVEAAEKLRVVATLSTFADLVKQIGGDHVSLHTVASPRFNPHFIEPKPNDIVRAARADLFVHAGVGLENPWSEPLIDASANRKILPGAPGNLDLSIGVTLLEEPTGQISRAQGDIHPFGNPHFWLNPENGRNMARAIAERLTQLDPDHAADYQQNLQPFLAKLDGKIAAWKALLEPAQGKEAIGYHNEWPYLAAFAGIRIGQFLEPKPGIPPTPRHLAFLEKYIRQHAVPAIFQATFYSKDAARALEKRTGIKLHLLAVNVGEIPEAGDYFSLFDHDVETIVKALKDK